MRHYFFKEKTRQNLLFFLKKIKKGQKTYRSIKIDKELLLSCQEKWQGKTQ